MFCRLATCEENQMQIFIIHSGKLLNCHVYMKLLGLQAAFTAKKILQLNIQNHVYVGVACGMGCGQHKQMKLHLTTQVQSNC